MERVTTNECDRRGERDTVTAAGAGGRRFLGEDAPLLAEEVLLVSDLCGDNVAVPEASFLARVVGSTQHIHLFLSPY